MKPVNSYKDILIASKDLKIYKYPKGEKFSPLLCKAPQIVEVCGNPSRITRLPYGLNLSEKDIHLLQTTPEDSTCLIRVRDYWIDEENRVSENVLAIYNDRGTIVYKGEIHETVH